MKEIFIQAIHEKRKIRITFFSQEDNRTLIRICAPMDYGPSRRAKLKNNRYHMWDYDSDNKPHTLSLDQDQIHRIDLLDEEFDPKNFITWDTQKNHWFVSRDWGIYS